MKPVAPALLARRYELHELAGRGGSGSVWRARDRMLGREVAVKVFPVSPAVAGTAGRARFEREARAAAAVSHPNVVAVHDVGVDEDVPFIVMELLPGGALADVIARGPMPVAGVVRILGDVLAGLEAAHRRDVLHRDIKPGNVLFAEDGRAVLSDFGIAATGDVALTEEGMVVGTPGYLAPERVAGRAATARTDVYACGVMAYEMLTGVRPFVADTPLALAYAVHEGRARPIRAHRGDVTAALESVVLRAMHRDPAARPATPAELADALLAARDATRVLPAAPIARHRVGVAPAARGRLRSQRGRRTALALGVAALAAVGLGALVRDDAPEPPAQSPVVDTTDGTLPAPVRDAFAELEDAVRP